MQARCVVVGVVVASAAAAQAAPGPGPGAIVVRGEVTAVASRWTADGSRIVTDAQIRAGDGTVTAVSQLGGTVGTLAMQTFPAMPQLEVGAEVEVFATSALTGAGRAVLAADHVEVIRPARLPFVRTGPTAGGAYFYWASGCAMVGIAEEGTRAIAGDTENDVFEAVLDSWNTDVAACSYMDLVSRGTLANHEVGKDRINIVKFRDVTWCRPAVDDDPARCYPPNTAGITTVTYVNDPGNDRDGEIVDADIELNGVDFAIAVNGVTLDNGACLAELANTLTHEIGHLLGLEHTCRVPDDPPRIDDTGASVPLCAATVDPMILDATMYNFQDCGETKKESLSADDIDAICSVYPIAADPMECSSPDTRTGCCDAGSGSSPAAPLLLSLLVGFGLVRRTRRTRLR